MSRQAIFISYSHRDEQYVRDLARRLEDAGLSPWYFTASQTAGVNWPQRLVEVIRQAQAVLVVITSASNSPEAEYVLAEVMLAQRERRFIIPLKLDQSTGPLDVMLAARNWINACDRSDPLPRILAAITAHSAVVSPLQGEDFAALNVDPTFRTYLNRETFNLSFPASAALLVQDETVTLCRLGRDPRGDMVVAGTLPYVSRQHARITAHTGPEGISFVLTDEQSRHGTYVNGARIDGPHTLLDGDQIGLGTPRCMLIFDRIAATGESPAPLDEPPR